jgi:hypothetical protein
MWLSIGFAVLAVFVVVGAVLLGGVFTLVLVPIAAITVFAAFAFSWWTRARGSGSGARERRPTPLPHSEHSNTASVPTTPAELTDARRLQQ